MNPTITKKTVEKLFIPKIDNFQIYKEECELKSKTIEDIENSLLSVDKEITKRYIYG